MSKAAAKGRNPLAAVDSNSGASSTARSSKTAELEAWLGKPLFAAPTAALEEAPRLVPAAAPQATALASIPPPPPPPALASVKAKPAKSTKRKAAEIEEPRDLPEIDSDDERLCLVTDNCDQVRRKILNLINSGDMKVGEFQRALGVSSAAYSNFMGRTGKYNGDLMDTYQQAFRFFKKRELQGVKEPKKKAKKAEEAQKNDVSAIQLDGEAEVKVPVYDTCDEIRKKISAYLRGPGVTKAGFLREIAKTYQDGRKMNSKSLSDFLGKKGPSAGNTSGIFYSSYVFFEKMRIRDGKPKSVFREEMERIWKRPGFDVKTLSSGGYWCSGNQRPVEDKYGQVTFHRY